MWEEEGGEWGGGRGVGTYCRPHWWRYGPWSHCSTSGSQHHRSCRTPQPEHRWRSPGSRRPQRGSRLNASYRRLLFNQKKEKEKRTKLLFFPQGSHDEWLVGHPSKGGPVPELIYRASSSSFSSSSPATEKSHVDAWSPSPHFISWCSCSCSCSCFTLTQLFVCTFLE